jgi:hypothetical protein
MRERELEELYGPAAAHAEHKRGDRIRYHLIGDAGEFEGTTVWVCAAGMVGSQYLDLRYMVERDGMNAWPDVVFPADVLV